MAKGKRKTKTQEAIDTIAGFRDLVTDTFEKITEKSVASWLREFQQWPREMPSGEQAPVIEATMSLVDAYAILGLPPTATLKEVKENYRRLAMVFHPDKGGYDEAMRLLNQARDRIKEEKGEK